MKITEAIILAGGLGTRLRSVLPDLPKCMAPINKIPFISFVIKNLLLKGVKKIVFSLGYKYNYFLDFLETIPSLNYEVVVEKEPLGTGGAIKLACEKIKNRHVIITNGDTLFKNNLNELVNFHLEKKSFCSLALAQINNFERYGTVAIDKCNKIIKFEEKKNNANGLINGGLYILDIKNFPQKLSTNNKFSFEEEYLVKYAYRGDFYGLMQKGYFIDIGIKEDYEKAQKDLNQ